LKQVFGFALLRCPLWALIKSPQKLKWHEAMSFVPIATQSSV